MSAPSSMVSGWLAAELIAGIKRRGSIPTSRESWTSADFLKYANDSMRSYIYPLIRRLSEEFFVSVFDTTLTAGTASYRPSYRILGEAFRDVQISDGVGGYASLPRREPHQVSSDTTTNKPSGYYLQDDKVVLVPTPSAADTLRLKAMLRPNNIVAADRIFNVETVGSGTAVLGRIDGDANGDNAATFFNSNADGGQVDIIRPKPGFRCIVIDTVATFSTNTATFQSGTTITNQLAVGDFVCIAGEAPMPQLPYELHPLLAQDVVCAVLRATNGGGYAEAVAERDRLEAIAVSLFSPRTENQPRFINNEWGVGGPSYRWRRG